MTNDALRDALARAGVTQAGLAAVCRVDPKTVGRWVADDGRRPHGRNRVAVAAALGVDEMTIWPRRVRAVVKTGADRELVTAYPTRSAVPAGLWQELIAGASREITFGGYTSYFVWTEQPNLRATLRAKTQAGVRVRFLLGDPDSPATAWKETVEGVPMTIRNRILWTLSELGKLDGAPIEVRVTDWHLGLSAFRFDDHMLVCVHVANLLGHESPTLHLRRRQDDGLFGQFAQHLTGAWDAARAYQS